jgi:hypothetical protein
MVAVFFLGSGAAYGYSKEQGSDQGKKNKGQTYIEKIAKEDKLDWDDHSSEDDKAASPVPEPATLVLLGVSLLSGAAYARKFHRTE